MIATSRTSWFENALVVELERDGSPPPSFSPLSSLRHAPPNLHATFDFVIPHHRLRFERRARMRRGMYYQRDKVHPSQLFYPCLRHISRRCELLVSSHRFFFDTRDSNNRNRLEKLKARLSRLPLAPLAGWIISPPSFRHTRVKPILLWKLLSSPHTSMENAKIQRPAPPHLVVQTHLAPPFVGRQVRWFTTSQNSGESRLTPCTPHSSKTRGKDRTHTTQSEKLSGDSRTPELHRT